MSRLQSEWQRLYLPPASAIGDGGEPSLIDAQERVRAMVLALARPAHWPAMSALWQAVQAELGLPAPAMAVSGVDAYQLWFSLAEPVTVEQAHAFLDALRRRYLADIAPVRVSLWPIAQALGGPDAPQSVQHAAAVPAQQCLAEQWSAFVAPDLAPMFADTPWLDIPPSPEGQAELLARLHSITPDQWQAALARLAPALAMAPAMAASPLPGLDTAGPHTDPRRFLLDVMNDQAVALALRIEAAKALLPYTASR